VLQYSKSINSAPVFDDTNNVKMTTKDETSQKSAKILDLSRICDDILFQLQIQQVPTTISESSNLSTLSTRKFIHFMNLLSLSVKSQHEIVLDKINALWLFLQNHEPIELVHNNKSVSATLFLFIDEILKSIHVPSSNTSLSSLHSRNSYLMSELNEVDILNGMHKEFSLLQKSPVVSIKYIADLFLCASKWLKTMKAVASFARSNSMKTT
jgi:hypothetical protein